MSNSERLKEILKEHRSRHNKNNIMSSYMYHHQGTSSSTLLADHRLPRAHLSGKNSPESNYGQDHHEGGNQHDVESSILVTKVPTVQKSPTAYGSTTASSSLKKVTLPSPDANRLSIWPQGNSVHRLTPAELEQHLKKMKQPQVISVCLDLASQLRLVEKQLTQERLLQRPQRSSDLLEKITEEDEEYCESESSSFGRRTRCRFSVTGCPFRLPSMELHEERECKYRPTRCPSLTCPVKPPFAKLLKHIEEEHDGTQKGRDRVCRNSSNHLVSSYVNVDKEPIFYKNSRMTWVANELLLEGKFHFFLECMRVPPEWHLWIYFLGDESGAEAFQATITLFREDEYGRMGDLASFSAQRSYTGPVISINRSKEEVAEYGLGFMVHDKQVRSLCGPISSQEEQLFGYEVTVYRKP